MLIQNAFATLTNGESSYSVVHISTDSKIVGQWVTGLPLVGQQNYHLLTIQCLVDMVQFVIFIGKRVI